VTTWAIAARIITKWAARSTRRGVLDDRPGPFGLAEIGEAIRQEIVGRRLRW
jgi:hypothetical protein